MWTKTYFGKYSAYYYWIERTISQGWSSRNGEYLVSWERNECFKVNQCIWLFFVQIKLYSRLSLTFTGIYLLVTLKCMKATLSKNKNLEDWDKGNYGLLVWMIYGQLISMTSGNVLVLHCTGLDPFPGKIHWMKVWWNNNNPKLILSYYLDTIEKLGCKFVFKFPTLKFLTDILRNSRLSPHYSKWSRIWKLWHSQCPEHVTAMEQSPTQGFCSASLDAAQKKYYARDLVVPALTTIHSWIWNPPGDGCD